MKIKQVILEQKKELPLIFGGRSFVPREAEEESQKLLRSSLVKVVIGPRRSGKSVLIYRLLSGKKYAYLDFDDERIASLHAEEVFPALSEVYGKDFDYIFFDEIQNLKNWELLVNRLHKRGINLLITGSNANLLSKELATHLTGRHLSLELYPFSFREYLRAINFNVDLETSEGVSLLKYELENYLKIGGFPEIVLRKEDQPSYLRDLYRRIIDRDIISRYRITHKETFKEICISLFSNPSRLISYNRLKKDFNLGSEHTVKNYLGYLEEAYLIFMVKRFSFKSKEIEKSDRKVYLIDLGLINSINVSGKGFIHENMVALELKRKSLNSGREIFYYKNHPNGYEADFVVRENFIITQIIQVCVNLTDAQTREREIRGLIYASKELNCTNLLIINSDEEKEEQAEWYGIKRKIKFIPLWKWLLTPEKYST